MSGEGVGSAGWLVRSRPQAALAATALVAGFPARPAGEGRAEETAVGASGARVLMAEDGRARGTGKYTEPLRPPLCPTRSLLDCYKRRQVSRCPLLSSRHLLFYIQPKYAHAT